LFLCLFVSFLLLGLAAAPRESLHFTPNTATVPALHDRIAQARKSIDVATYALNDSALAKLLAQKAFDGVTVRLIVDRQPLGSKSPKSSAPQLHDAGATVKLFGMSSGSGGKLRNCNFIVIDGASEGGSVIVAGGPLVRFELESGIGTIIVLDDPAAVRDAQAAFEELLDRSARFVPPYDQRDSQGKPKPKPKPGF